MHRFDLPDFSGDRNAPAIARFPSLAKGPKRGMFLYFERTINTFNPSKKRFPSCLTKEEQFIGATPPL